MIAGLGIDLVDLDRIRAIYKRFDLRFARHILSSRETDLMPSQPVAFLGGRFAAKEAAVKALGSGFASGITPAQIEILPDCAGKPELFLSGRALARAEVLGASKFHLSISHERNCAVALVILEA